MRVEGMNMKPYFEEPTLRFILFDVCDVLTSSPTEPENPDDETPGGDTPFIGN